MHHAGSHYGSGAMPTTNQLFNQGPQQQQPNQQTQLQTTQQHAMPTGTTTSLRQWRKKQNTPEPAQAQDSQGHIAHIAPHAHYPKSLENYRFPPAQYPQEFGLPYKDITPAPVKYSEIVEPAPAPSLHIEQHISPITHRAKDKEYLERCNLQQQQQQQQMKSYQENMKSYSPIVQQYVNVNKESQQMHPYIPKEQSGPPFAPYYKINNQYPSTQPRTFANTSSNEVPNHFQMDLYNNAQRHLSEQQMYQLEQRQFAQSQRLYRAPPQVHPSPNLQYQRNNPQQFPPQNYPHPHFKQTIQHDPYRMHSFQPGPPTSHKFQIPQNMQRRFMPDNTYPPKFNPNYNPCVAPLEYAQHYQRRPGPEGQQPKDINLLMQMPDVNAENIPKSSLKSFIETWNDDMGAEAANQEFDPNKIRMKNPSEENLYIFDSTEIPSENIQPFLHLQVEKIPDNIKGFYKNSVIRTSPENQDGALNLVQNSVIKNQKNYGSPNAPNKDLEYNNLIEAPSSVEFGSPKTGDVANVASPKPVTTASLPNLMDLRTSNSDVIIPKSNEPTTNKTIEFASTKELNNVEGPKTSLGEPPTLLTKIVDVPKSPQEISAEERLCQSKIIEDYISIAKKCFEERLLPNQTLEDYINAAKNCYEGRLTPSRNMDEFIKVAKVCFEDSQTPNRSMEDYIAMAKTCFDHQERAPGTKSAFAAPKTHFLEAALAKGNEDVKADDVAKVVDATEAKPPNVIETNENASTPTTVIEVATPKKSPQISVISETKRFLEYEKEKVPAKPNTSVIVYNDTSEKPIETKDYDADASNGSSDSNKEEEEEEERLIENSDDLQEALKEQGVFELSPKSIDDLTQTCIVANTPDLDELAPFTIAKLMSSSVIKDGHNFDNQENKLLDDAGIGALIQHDGNEWRSDNEAKDESYNLIEDFDGLDDDSDASLVGDLDPIESHFLKEDDEVIHFKASNNNLDNTVVAIQASVNVVEEKKIALNELVDSEDSLGVETQLSIETQTEIINKIGSTQTEINCNFVATQTQIKNNFGSTQTEITNNFGSTQTEASLNSEGSTQTETISHSNYETQTPIITNGIQTTQTPTITNCIQTTQTPIITNCIQTTQTPIITNCIQTTQTPIITNGIQTTQTPIITNCIQTTQTPIITNCIQSTQTPTITNNVQTTQTRSITNCDVGIQSDAFNQSNDPIVIEENSAIINIAGQTLHIKLIEKNGSMLVSVVAGDNCTLLKDEDLDENENGLALDSMVLINKKEAEPIITVIDEEDDEGDEVEENENNKPGIGLKINLDNTLSPKTILHANISKITELLQGTKDLIEDDTLNKSLPEINLKAKQIVECMINCSTLLRETHGISKNNPIDLTINDWRKVFCIKCNKIIKNLKNNIRIPINCEDCMECIDISDASCDDQLVIKSQIDEFNGEISIKEDKADQVHDNNCEIPSNIDINVMVFNEMEDADNNQDAKQTTSELAQILESDSEIKQSFAEVANVESSSEIDSTYDEYRKLIVKPKLEDAKHMQSNQLKNYKKLIGGEAKPKRRLQSYEEYVKSKIINSKNDENEAKLNGVENKSRKIKKGDFVLGTIKNNKHLINKLETRRNSVDKLNGLQNVLENDEVTSDEVGLIDKEKNHQLPRNQRSRLISIDLTDSDQLTLDKPRRSSIDKPIDKHEVPKPNLSKSSEKDISIPLRSNSSDVSLDDTESITNTDKAKNELANIKKHPADKSDNQKRRTSTDQSIAKPESNKNPLEKVPTPMPSPKKNKNVIWHKSIDTKICKQPGDATNSKINKHTNLDKKDVAIASPKQDKSIPVIGSPKHTNKIVASTNKNNNSEIVVEVPLSPKIIKQIAHCKADSLKEPTKEKIDSLKEPSKDKIDSLKEPNKAKIDGLKEPIKEKIDSLKEPNKAKIDGLKEPIKEKIDSLKDSNNKIDLIENANKKIKAVTDKENAFVDQASTDKLEATEANIVKVQNPIKRSTEIVTSKYKHNFSILSKENKKKIKIKSPVLNDKLASFVEPLTTIKPTEVVVASPKLITKAELKENAIMMYEDLWHKIEEKIDAEPCVKPIIANSCVSKSVDDPNKKRLSYDEYIKRQNKKEEPHKLSLEEYKKKRRISADVQAVDDTKRRRLDEATRFPIENSATYYNKYTKNGDKYPDFGYKHKQNVNLAHQGYTTVDSYKLLNGNTPLRSASNYLNEGKPYQIKTALKDPRLESKDPRCELKDPRLERGNYFTKRDDVKDAFKMHEVAKIRVSGDVSVEVPNLLSKIAKPCIPVALEKDLKVIDDLVMHVDVTHDLGLNLDVNRSLETNTQHSVGRVPLKLPLSAEINNQQTAQKDVGVSPIKSNLNIKPKLPNQADTITNINNNKSLKIDQCINTLKPDLSNSNQDLCNVITLVDTKMNHQTSLNDDLKHKIQTKLDTIELNLPKPPKKREDLNKKIDDLFSLNQFKKSEDDLLRKYQNGVVLKGDEVVKVNAILERKKFEQRRIKLNFDLDQLKPFQVETKTKPIIDVNEIGLDTFEPNKNAANKKAKCIIDFEDFKVPKKFNLIDLNEIVLPIFNGESKTRFSNSWEDDSTDVWESKANNPTVSKIVDDAQSEANVDEPENVPIDGDTDDYQYDFEKVYQPEAENRRESWVNSDSWEQYSNVVNSEVADNVVQSNYKIIKHMELHQNLLSKELDAHKPIESIKPVEVAEDNLKEDNEVLIEPNLNLVDLQELVHESKNESTICKIDSIQINDSYQNPDNTQEDCKDVKEDKDQNEKTKENTCCVKDLDESMICINVPNQSKIDEINESDAIQIQSNTIDASQSNDAGNEILNHEENILNYEENILNHEENILNHEKNINAYVQDLSICEEILVSIPIIDAMEYTNVAMEEEVVIQDCPEITIDASSVDNICDFVDSHFVASKEDNQIPEVAININQDSDCIEINGEVASTLIIPENNVIGARNDDLFVDNVSNFVAFNISSENVIIPDIGSKIGGVISSIGHSKEPIKKSTRSNTKSDEKNPQVENMTQSVTRSKSDFEDTIITLAVNSFVANEINCDGTNNLTEIKAPNIDLTPPVTKKCNARTEKSCKVVNSFVANEIKYVGTNNLTEIKAPNIDLTPPVTKKCNASTEKIASKPLTNRKRTNKTSKARKSLTKRLTVEDKQIPYIAIEQADTSNNLNLGIGLKSRLNPIIPNISGVNGSSLTAVDIVTAMIDTITGNIDITQYPISCDSTNDLKNQSIASKQSCAKEESIDFSLNEVTKFCNIFEAKPVKITDSFATELQTIDKFAVKSKRKVNVTPKISPVTKRECNKKVDVSNTKKAVTIHKTLCDAKKAVLPKDKHKKQSGAYKIDAKVRQESEALKLRLKKVDATQTGGDKLKLRLKRVNNNNNAAEKQLKLKKQKKRKRFRNLYAADSDDDEVPAVDDYSVHESNINQLGLPKLIIKRKVDMREHMQPVVKIERNPHLDYLAKRKRKV